MQTLTSNPTHVSGAKETALRRWLYRGKRPNWIARLVNGAWAAVVSMGLARGPYVALQVPGRKTGRIVSFPLVMVAVTGQRYLVSMLGDRARWVLNLRAAGGRATLRKGGREQVRLEEVPVGLRAPIIKAYLQIAHGAQPHMPVQQDAPLAEFEKIAAAYPVFRVVSAQAKITSF